MGIIDLFRRRRQRESALAPGAIEELTGVADRPTSAGAIEAGSAEPAGAAGPGAGTVLPGADAAGFGAMLKRALETGEAQISTDSHTIDATGGGLRDEILGILGAHGIEPGVGEQRIDAADLPGLQDEILELLRDKGIDLRPGERHDEGDDGRERD